MMVGAASVRSYHVPLLTMPVTLAMMTAVDDWLFTVRYWPSIALQILARLVPLISFLATYA